MVNSLADIQKRLDDFDLLSPYPLEPFWDMPPFGADPYWGASANVEPNTLFVSGPSRNGNHLVHSMLDNHPDLPSAAGEDSFLAAFFEDARKDPEEARRKLCGNDNVDYILDLSGYGTNKWKQLAESAQSGGTGKTAVWSGVQERQAFVADYQDTLVSVDYVSYLDRLKEVADDFRKVPTFMDALWIYLDAFNRLAPRPGNRKYTYIMFGSGMRAESWFVFNRTRNVKCVVPLRPFDSYYRSFAKGREGSDAEVDTRILQEAWEHWWHKAVDYLLLKKHFPDRFCLVNFEHLVSETDLAASAICEFLGISDSPTCRIPTVLGVPTKGNSSFPKAEEHRGAIYSDGLKNRLPREYWPDLVEPIWKMISTLSV